MTLRELLRTLRTGMLRDTSDRVSGDSDQLWSDTELIGYIDQAERRFARRSLCIRDATSDISRFSTVPFQHDYVLDASILSVTSIRSLGNGTWVPGQSGPRFVTTTLGVRPVYPDHLDLARISHSERRGQGHYGLRDSDIAWDVNSLGTRGFAKPYAFETDEATVELNGSSGIVSVRLHPAPDQYHGECVMQMRVCRLPLLHLTQKNLEAVPEIPEDYHLDMLDYAAYLALRIVDHEAGDPTRAQEFQASFDRHVEEARLEIDRKRFAPMRWGFGANGFSYPPN